ncbi:MAG: hypothetical protein ACXVCO_05425 [Ktedonobacterales bacterium]
MATEENGMATGTPHRLRSSESTTSPTRTTLDHYASWGQWALPVWAVLLFYGTLTHQPDPGRDFPGYARYITTAEFEVSHLVASIFGAGVGTLGFTALFVALAKRRTAPLALCGFVAAALGNTIITSVFGAAAFAQPAIGRAYLSGHTAEAIAFNNDVYGPALFATALLALLLLTIGIVLFGVAVTRSGFLPSWAGIGLMLGIVLFAVIGFVLADFVQSIGAALLVVSTTWIAIAGWRALRL